MVLIFAPSRSPDSMLDAHSTFGSVRRWWSLDADVGPSGVEGLEYPYLFSGVEGLEYPYLFFSWSLLSRRFWAASASALN